MVYRHDPGMSDVLVKDLRLERGTSVQTPAVHDATDDEPEPLNQTPSSNYRSQVARCLFLSEDRADMTFIVNELVPTHVQTPLGRASQS